jgi:tetratricopeptide (TPR) repeat protein
VPYAVPVPAPYVVETEVVEPTTAVPPAVQNGAVIPAAGAAAEFQLEAEQAFEDHRYEDAARLSNHAIVEDSQNGKLHLFASQTFFALEDYASAAAAVQQAASLLDRSEWGFVVENYQQFYRGDDYVTQMAKLDKHIEQNPEAAYAYFLRGYHYLFLGHKEAARDDLAKAVALENRDVLAAELLKMAGGQVPDAVPVPNAEE